MLENRRELPLSYIDIGGEILPSLDPTQNNRGIGSTSLHLLNDNKIPRIEEYIIPRWSTINYYQKSKEEDHETLI